MFMNAMVNKDFIVVNFLCQEVKDYCLKDYKEKTKKEIDLQIDTTNYLPEDW